MTVKGTLIYRPPPMEASQCYRVEKVLSERFSFFIEYESLNELQKRLLNVDGMPDGESLIGTQLFGTVYTLKIPLKVFLGYKMCQKVVFLLVIPRRENEDDGRQ